MTLLMAARAADGIAAVSDRKESRRGLPGREVKKCHMDEDGGLCVSLAGNGRAAAGLLGRIAAGGAGPSAGIAERIRGHAASLYEQFQVDIRVDGILIAAGSQGCDVYDLYISSGHAVLRPNSGAMSVHGDRAAIAVCRSLAERLEIRGALSGEAAAILHTLASRVAATVDSVGGREEYGFDLAVFSARGGGAELLERCTGELGAPGMRRGPRDGQKRPQERAGKPGALEVRFRLSGLWRAGGARTGGGAHG